MDNRDLNNVQDNNQQLLESIQKTQVQLVNELNRLNKVHARVKRRTTLLVAIIAVLILITGTMAWFTLNSFSSVDNITMEITTGIELRVDTVNHGSDISQYKKVITNEMINGYLAGAGGTNKSLTDLKLDPLTTPSGMDPFKTQKGGTVKANSDTYLEYKVFFIASREMWVHLSSDTATLENKQATTSVTTTSTGTKADVVRAVRVSFESGGSAAIYEPNKGNPVAGQKTFDLGSPGTYSNDTRLFHLNEKQPLEVTIRLWAEGEDPECDDDVQEANLNVALLFAGTDDANQPMS